MPPRTVRAPAGKNTSHTRSKLSKSLKEVYEDQCKERQVHANSALLSTLPERQGVALPSDVVDLTRNFLGDNGIIPFLQVIERTPTIRKVIFVENGLRNNSIKALCAIASKHAGLTSIDVSDNYISEGAGLAILKLLEENPKITEFKIRNTKIDVELRVKIKDTLERNNAGAASFGAAAGRKAAQAAPTAAAS